MEGPGPAAKPHARFEAGRALIDSSLLLIALAGYALLQIALLLGLPFGIARGARALKLEGWLSPVVLCYLIGIALGNLEPFPLDSGISKLTQESTVALAIPLLLISTNVLVWLHQARSMTLSFGLAVLAVTGASLACFWMFPGQAQGWMISAMLAAGLTGSALNMNAVGIAVEAPESLIGLVNLSDIINGGIYLIFLTSIAQRVLRKFLPAYSPTGAVAEEFQREWYGSKRNYLRKGWIFLRAFGLSAVIVGLASLITWLLMGELHEAVTILMLTVLSIGGSFLPRLRTFTGAYELGQYFLLVFCIAIGMEADFRELVHASPSVFAYSATLFVLAVGSHFALARLFRLDSDTVLITSTAAIYGPPFIPQVALALNNRELVFPGIITALAGYAVGNFLGIGVGYLIRLWAGL
jgi:uncharacterized membrane protein